MPVRIQRDEEGVAPRPGVVISQKANKLHLVLIARIKGIRFRQRIELVSRSTHPYRSVMGSTIQQVHSPLLVSSCDEEDGRGCSIHSKIAPLVDVDLVDLIWREHCPEFIDAEVVAQSERQI